MLGELEVRPRSDCAIRVMDGDVRVPEARWRDYRLSQTDLPVAIRIVPMPPAIPFIIAALAYAAQAATAAALTAAIGATAAGIVGAVVGIAVGVGGALLTRSLIAPSSLGALGGGSAGLSNSPTIQGTQNAKYPFGPIWRVFGEHWVTFPLAATPYTEIVGGKQFLRMLFSAGYGPLAFSDWKIGDTDLENFDNVQLEYFDGLVWRSRDVTTGVESVIPEGTLFKDDYDEEAVGASLDFPTKSNDATEPSDWVVRTTASDAEEISFDLLFASGLYQAGSTGVRHALAVQFEVQIKPAADPDTSYVGAEFSDFGIYATQGVYTTTVGTFPASVTTIVIDDGVLEVKAKSTAGFTTGGKIRPATAGQYTLRLRRLKTRRGTSNTPISDADWTVLRSWRSVARIVPDVTQIALRIQASDQLAGVVQYFRAKVSGMARPFLGIGEVGADAEGYGAYQVTRNPAWWFLHRFTDPTVTEPVDADEVDVARIQAWAAYCEPTPGDYSFAFDHVRDYATTRYQMAELIAGAGRASYTMRNGKHSVVIDGPKATPVQGFTTRNTRNFSGAVLAIDEVHAARVNYLDEEKENKTAELIVYQPGYDVDTATKFTTFELPGVTRKAQAYADARKRLLESSLRRGLYTFDTDHEYKVAERGDRVRLSHDVPIANVKAGRIAALTEDATHWLTLEIDEELTFEYGSSYAAEVSSVAPVASTIVLTTAAIDNPATVGEPTVVTHTVTFTTPVLKADGTTWKVGDYAAVGLAGQATIEAVLKEVIPDTDDTATLVCTDYADAMFAEDSATPPEPLDSKLYGTPPAPQLKTVTTVGEQVALSWVVLQASDKRVEIAGFQLQYRTADPEGPWTDGPPIQADKSTVAFALELDSYYDFRIRSFSKLATWSRWDYWTAYGHLPGGLSADDFEVVGFEIKNRSGFDTWTSRDLELLWRLNVRGSSPLTVVPDTLAGYRITITDPDGTYRRSELVTDPRYNYSLSKSQEDSFRLSVGVRSLPARSLIVRIAAVDTSGGVSAETIRAVSNPAPAVPTLLFTQTAGGLNAVWSATAEPDFTKIVLWRGDASGFTVDDAHRIYQGRENPIFIDTSGVTDTWYRYAAVDDFSEDPSLLNLSAPVEYTGGLIDTGDLAVGAATYAFAVGQGWAGVYPTSAPDRGDGYAYIGHTPSGPTVYTTGPGGIGIWPDGIESGDSVTLLCTSKVYRTGGGDPNPATSDVYIEFWNGSSWVIIMNHGVTRYYTNEYTTFSNHWVHTVATSAPGYRVLWYPFSGTGIVASVSMVFTTQVSRR